MASLLIVTDEVMSDLTNVPDLYVEETSDQYNGPWPVAMVRMDAGTWQYDTAVGFDGLPMRFGVHTINIRLLYPRKDLKRDLRKVAAIDNGLVNALMKGATEAAGGDRFNGSIVGLGNLSSGGGAPIRYSTGSYNLGGVDCIAIEYTMDVTVEEQIV